MCALCCQFLWIVHVRYSLTCILRHVCLMLPVSLDCPCSVFSNVYSSSCVALCCQFLWIVHVRYSLTCILRHVCLMCQFLWIVHVRYSLTCILRHVCLMLPVSLDCPCSVFSNVYSSSCVPYVASSLDCPCSVFSNVYSSSCVTDVASFSGLSMFGIL